MCARVWMAAPIDDWIMSECRRRRAASCPRRRHTPFLEALGGHGIHVNRRPESQQLLPWRIDPSERSTSCHSVKEGFGIEVDAFLKGSNNWSSLPEVTAACAAIQGKGERMFSDSGDTTHHTRQVLGCTSGLWDGAVNIEDPKEPNFGRRHSGWIPFKPSLKSDRRRECDDRGMFNARNRMMVALCYQVTTRTKSWFPERVKREDKSGAIGAYTSDKPYPQPGS
ncbi:hypothetical protein QBC37DRAFT_399485 [Rhypophila decipiens]|uniref:Uncharacterized protein n=1 Tax=Rhypophila decipiens TaxID=261697 RepID=A0AAN6Y8I5_9PEZI|nr:hypothetical protein QBC37DRAFT_399485 [Rhypophila decipiens]